MHNIKSKYVECHCAHPEHLCRFTLDNEDGEDWPTFYLDVNLSSYLGFWKRIWHAVRYVFGISKCGWAEIMLDEEKVSQVLDICNEYRVAMDKYFASRKEN